MSRLRRTHVKPIAALGLSTTIAEAWDPPTGKRVRLMGVAGISETSGTPVTVVVVDGTAAASGTIGYFDVAGGPGTPTADVDFGDAGLYATKNNEIGLKTLADGATISCTLVGREESF